MVISGFIPVIERNFCRNFADKKGLILVPLMM